MTFKKVRLVLGGIAGFSVLFVYQNCAPVHDSLNNDSNSSLQINASDFELPSNLKINLTNDCLLCHPEASTDKIAITGEDMARIGWISPKDGANSLVIEYLETPNGPKRMPPSGPRWAQTDINDFKAWIDDIGSSGGGTPTGQSITYENDIRPILEARCTSCHGTRAGVNLESYSEVIKHVSLSTPDTPVNSGLYRTTFEGLYNPSSRTAMPPDTRNAATAEEIQKIAEWIATGAPEK